MFFLIIIIITKHFMNMITIFQHNSVDREVRVDRYVTTSTVQVRPRRHVSGYTEVVINVTRKQPFVVSVYDIVVNGVGRFSLRLCQVGTTWDKSWDFLRSVFCSF